MVKVQFKGPELLGKGGHYFKKNCTHLLSLCLHEQVGDTIVVGWPQFECNFNVFADMISPYGSHCIDMTASPRTYQRRYRHVVVMLCNVWLGESSRAPALWRHDHNVDDQNMVALPIVGGRLAMLTDKKLPSKYNNNEMKSMSIQRWRPKDSRQVRCFLK